jgi:hypothetical protein
VDLIELFKSFGPPGAICVVLWVALYKSEQREAKKDARIQLLENQLRESYDERVTAADRLSDALHGNAKAMDSLIGEIRSGKSVKRN